MKKYIIIIFLLFFSSNSFSEIVNKVVVLGNERISKETILVYGEISVPANYEKNDLNKIIKNLYSTNFFDDIRTSIKNGVLEIIIKEYPIINSITVEGEPKEERIKQLKDTIQTKKNSPYIKNIVSDDIEIIKKLYLSQGFNFTKINSKIEEITENRINLFFFIEKGEKTKISKINFIGDKKIRDRRLRDIIVSQEHKFWKVLTKSVFLNNRNIELDKRLLSNYYKSLGYYDVQVLSSNAEIETKSSTVLTYNIDAGTRYRIQKISTNVDSAIDKSIFVPLNKKFKKIVGNYYSPFTIKKLLDEVDLLVAKNDVQFVEHSVSEILVKDNIEVKINIYEGEKQIVEKINIKGNSVTNESVIRSELLLDEGDPFSLLKLKQSISRIQSRGIFSDVKRNISDGSIKNSKIIDIIVEEQPTGEISAGAGVGTNGGSIAFTIKENNYLGRGLEVSTSIEADEESLKGQVRVIDPNFNFSGNSVGWIVSSTSNDKPDAGYKNSLMTSGINTTFEQYKDVYLTAALNLNYDDLEVQSTASDSLKKQAGTFTDLAFDYGIRLDTRDKAYMPTSGSIASFAQTIPLYADTPYLRNKFTLSKYNAFGEDVVGSFKFYLSSINGLQGEDVRLSKRAKIPSTRLRGFKPAKIGPKDGTDYVGGNYAAAINLETNLPNLFPESTKTDVGLFLDFGNLWGVDYDSSVDESNKIRSSVGINTSWLSPIGPMSFVLSQNLSKADTDETQSFTFNLGTSF